MSIFIPVVHIRSSVFFYPLLFQLPICGVHSFTFVYCFWGWRRWPVALSISRGQLHITKNTAQIFHMQPNKVCGNITQVLLTTSKQPCLRPSEPGAYFMVILSEPISLMLLPVGSKEQQHRQSSKLTIPNTLYLARRLLSFTETLPLLLCGLP